MNNKPIFHGVEPKKEIEKPIVLGKITISEYASIKTSEIPPETTHIGVSVDGNEDNNYIEFSFFRQEKVVNESYEIELKRYNRELNRYKNQLKEWKELCENNNKMVEKQERKLLAELKVKYEG